jgi:predicted acetyltransferase
MSTPKPGIEVRVAAPRERLPVFRMLELYQHDLSDIWDQDLDLHGEYGYALDRYWLSPDCWPYVFLVDGKYAGFGLVDREVKIPGDDFWVDQFFVVRKCRRMGVGDFAAKHIFARHVGRWQVGQMPANHAARAFWRKVIDEFTGGRFAEQNLVSGGWQGSVQRFTSVGHADA